MQINIMTDVLTKGQVIQDLKQVLTELYKSNIPHFHTCNALILLLSFLIG